MKIQLGELRKIIREAVRNTSVILLEKAGDKCLNCGTSKELDDDNFCGECGANVSEICVKESCKAQVSVDDDYCGECGAPQFRRDPAAKKHIEQAREYQKRDDEIALRKKLWKDAGGTSNDADRAVGDKVMNDYYEALENRVMARIGKNPEEIAATQAKFQEARAAWKNYIKSEVELGQRYYTSLVKAGIANDEQKKLADELTAHLKKYPRKSK